MPTLAPQCSPQVMYCLGSCTPCCAPSTSAERCDLWARKTGCKSCLQMAVRSRSCMKEQLEWATV